MVVNNKASLICDLISEEHINLACIIETWLGPKGGVLFSEMCLPGFRVWHQLDSTAGEGLAVITRESLLVFRDVTTQVEIMFLKKGNGTSWACCYCTHLQAVWKSS